MSRKHRWLQLFSRLPRLRLSHVHGNGIRRRRLGAEPLEDRRLLAVTVGWQTGTTDINDVLVIQGDSASDTVLIDRPRIGDLTHDGVVDIFDWGAVSGSWGGPGPAGDANGDGTVDTFDNGTVNNNRGQRQKIRVTVNPGPGQTVYEYIEFQDPSAAGDKGVASIDIQMGDGADTVIVDTAMFRDIVCNGGGGADMLWAVTNTNWDEELTVDGENDALTLHTGTGVVSYTNLEAIELHANGADDLIAILGSTGDDEIVIDDTTVDLNGLTIELEGAEALSVQGDDGNDVLDAAAIDAAIFLTMSGDDDDDVLVGGDGADSLFGALGDDTLVGGGGNDALEGGAGSDVYAFYPGSLGSDTITESSNADSDTLDFRYLMDDLSIDLGDDAAQTIASGVLVLELSNDSAIENVIGGNGNDVIIGNSRANILEGRYGNDTLPGSSGNDVLYGGDGDDLLRGENGHDVMYGGNGDDDLYGGSGSDYFYGEDGNDYMLDYESSGSLTEGGDDFMSGGAGNDILHGLSGNDTLEGGEGNDSLYGWAGNDKYVFNWVPGMRSLGSDTLNESASSGTDTLEFSAFRAAYTAPSLSTVGPHVVNSDLLSITYSSASNIESIVAPEAEMASATVLFADTAAIPGYVRLLVGGVREDGGGSIDDVDFYLDTNRNGRYDGGDTLLGTDSDGTDGWAFNMNVDDAPIGAFGILAVPNGNLSGEGIPAIGQLVNRIRAVPKALPVFTSGDVDALQVNAISDVMASVPTNLVDPVSDEEYTDGTDSAVAIASLMANTSDADGSAFASASSYVEMVSGATTSGVGISSIATGTVLESNIEGIDNDMVASANALALTGTWSTTYREWEFGVLPTNPTSIQLNASATYYFSSAGESTVDAAEANAVLTDESEWFYVEITFGMNHLLTLEVRSGQITEWSELGVPLVGGGIPIDLAPDDHVVTTDVNYTQMGNITESVLGVFVSSDSAADVSDVGSSTTIGTDGDSIAIRFYAQQYVVNISVVGYA